MEIKLCGVGGQGMGFAGRLLGEAAIIAGFHAAQTTAYGVESRGGLSTADVIISREPILFPEVRRPDVLLLLAEKGLTANLCGAHERTLILHDRDTVPQLPPTPGVIYTLPLQELALKEFHNREASTIIATGYFMTLKATFPFEALEEAARLRLP